MHRFPTDFFRLVNPSPTPSAGQAKRTELRAKRHGSHYSRTRPTGLLPGAAAARTGSPAHAEHRPCSYSSLLLPLGKQDDRLAAKQAPTRRPLPRSPRAGLLPVSVPTEAAAGAAGGSRGPGLRCRRGDSPGRECWALTGAPGPKPGCQSRPRPHSCAAGCCCPGGSRVRCAVPFRCVPFRSSPPGSGGRVSAAHRKRRPAVARPWRARAGAPASTRGWG